VRSWTTLNEPWVSSILGYAHGLHAPGERDWSRAIDAAHGLLRAHGMAVPVIRANVPEARVGIVLNLTPIRPATDSGADRAAAHRHDGHLNRWFLDPLFGRGYPEDVLEAYGEHAPDVAAGDMEAIAAPIDFLGINYYMTFAHRDAPDQPPVCSEPVDVPGLHTEMGWLVDPDGLHELLVRLDREYPPIDLYVTENGAAFDDPEPDAAGEVDDPLRVEYLRTHLAAGARAIEDGVRLRGWFAWSLLDNFEWGFGYSKRFGIVHVDFTTRQRTIKRSGHAYAAAIAASRGLVDHAAGTTRA
jgi:beta-glucosidase